MLPSLSRHSDVIMLYKGEIQEVSLKMLNSADKNCFPDFVLVYLKVHVFDHSTWNFNILEALSKF